MARKPAPNPTGAPSRSAGRRLAQLAGSNWLEAIGGYWPWVLSFDDRRDAGGLLARYGCALDLVAEIAPRLGDCGDGVWEAASSDVERRRLSLAVFSREMVARCEFIRGERPAGARKRNRTVRRLNSRDALAQARALETVAATLRDREALSLEDKFGLARASGLLSKNRPPEGLKGDLLEKWLTAFRLTQVMPGRLAEALDSMAHYLRTRKPRATTSAGASSPGRATRLAAILSGRYRVATGADFSYQAGDFLPSRGGGKVPWPMIDEFVRAALGEDIDSKERVSHLRRPVEDPI